MRLARTRDGLWTASATNTYCEPVGKIDCPQWFSADAAVEALHRGGLDAPACPPPDAS